MTSSHVHTIARLTTTPIIILGHGESLCTWIEHTPYNLWFPGFRIETERTVSNTTLHDGLIHSHRWSRKTYTYTTTVKQQTYNSTAATFNFANSGWIIDIDLGISDNLHTYNTTCIVRVICESMNWEWCWLVAWLVCWLCWQIWIVLFWNSPRFPVTLVCCTLCYLRTSSCSVAL